MCAIMRHLQLCLVPTSFEAYIRMPDNKADSFYSTLIFYMGGRQKIYSYVVPFDAELYLFIFKDCLNLF